MARPAGFEPATVRLEGGCSIQLSYRRPKCGAGIGEDAAEDKDGTHDGELTWKIDPQPQKSCNSKF